LSELVAARFHAQKGGMKRAHLDTLKGVAELPEAGLQEIKK